MRKDTFARIVQCLTGGFLGQYVMMTAIRDGVTSGCNTTMAILSGITCGIYTAIGAVVLQDRLVTMLCDDGRQYKETGSS